MSVASGRGGLPDKAVAICPGESPDVAVAKNGEERLSSAPEALAWRLCCEREHLQNFLEYAPWP